MGLPNDVSWRRRLNATTGSQFWIRAARSTSHFSGYSQMWTLTGPCSAVIPVGIEAEQGAIDPTPDPQADLPSWLMKLMLLATQLLVAAHIIPAEGPRQYPAWLNTISIFVFQQAVQLAPEGHPRLPVWLNELWTSVYVHLLPALLRDLALALQTRFDRTGDLDDLAKAISAGQRAVNLTSKDHPELPARLSDLGNSFESRFKRSGNLIDIAEAISAQQQAVLLTPEGHIDLPAYLSNLGVSFITRYERTGDLVDIDEAISVIQNAIQIIPEGNVHLPGLFNNLGIALQLRFDRTGNSADVAEAIAMQQRAVYLTPAGHLDLYARLTNLGVSLRSLANRTGDPDKLEEAIAAQRRAIRLTPGGHTDLPLLFNDLGTSFEARFDLTGDLADIMEAVIAHQEAVKLTPEGHAGLPSRLYDLGNSVYSSAVKSGNSTELNASIAHFSSAATSHFGAPRDKFKAARRWARLLSAHSPLSPDVISAFDVAIRLLALVAGLEQTVEGRYTQLQDASGIALEGAAAACRLQRPDKAVEWLEQGRCLVWSQLNHLRTPLDDLQAHDSELARRLTDVSRNLQRVASSRNTLNPSMNMMTKISVQHELRSHLDLSKEWESLLSTVRSIPGFASFLQPSRCSDLMRRLPPSGSVVIINVNEDRCDAIVLLSGSKAPLHIPLPSFSLEKASKYRHALNVQLQSKGIRMREVEVETDGHQSERALKRWNKTGPSSFAVRNVLRGLWIEVVKPILDLLGYSVSAAP